MSFYYSSRTDHELHLTLKKLLKKKSNILNTWMLIFFKSRKFTK